MINSYGADSVRWFILSDSPPDRDVQWSTEGVTAAHIFDGRSSHALLLDVFTDKGIGTMIVSRG